MVSELLFNEGLISVQLFTLEESMDNGWMIDQVPTPSSGNAGVFPALNPTAILPSGTRGP